MYVYDIWNNIDSSIRLFADDCIIYRKITNKNSIEKFQKKINPGKRKPIRFTRARVKIPLCYSLGDQKIREERICKYLGIILRSDLNWVDQVNHTTQKAWKALHFVMRVLKKGNRKTKRLAYTSLVRPALE